MVNVEGYLRIGNHSLTDEILRERLVGCVISMTTVREHWGEKIVDVQEGMIYLEGGEIVELEKLLSYGVRLPEFART